MSEPSPARAEAGYALLFAGLFLALGAQIAFYQLWLVERGFSAAAIGDLNAAAVAVRIAAGAALPALADRLGAPRAAMAAAALAGAACAALHLAAADAGAIVGLALLLAMSFAGLNPIAEAQGYASAEARGFSYRRARSFGSFAFLSATFAVGLVVERFGADAVPVWIAGALLLAALGALAAPSAVAEGPRPSLRDGSALLRDAAVLRFLLVAATLQAAHAVYYVYGSVHWAALGFSATVIGALWAIGVLAEIALFLLCGAWIARLDPGRVFVVAGLANAARWGAMALEPGLAATAALQALHALTFGAAHLAGLAFIARATPRSLAASAQGLLSAASGLGMLLVTLGAAALYPAFGAGAYALPAVLAALAAALALGLTTPAAQPQSAGSGAAMRAPR